MTSAIKFENHQNKYHIQPKNMTMTKNLHLSKVIPTTPLPHVHHFNNVNPPSHGTTDALEMTRLLSNIVATSKAPSLRATSISPKIDYPSRLNHFSWEEIEGRYLPVIYRYRYVQVESIFKIFLHILYRAASKDRFFSSN